ncbi:hypothetical protein POTOM_061047 [Populus tomentosa]|uniref:Major facilitator superfamily (MFS) profile domain-containing protein n=1 Tax=Populus tomentosa TaxID=118781 RepID=A0A8X7XZ38_POPTO|nr:hypothetical protein POTOM_061047 [Populus tomentosa]
MSDGTRAVFSALDNAKTQLYHFKAIFIAGQLFFGWLGDKLGRKKVYGITLVTMVGCALLLAFPLDPQRRVWLVVSASSASGVVLALEETLSCDYV